MFKKWKNLNMISGNVQKMEKFEHGFRILEG